MLLLGLLAFTNEKERGHAGGGSVRKTLSTLPWANPVPGAHPNQGKLAREWHALKNTNHSAFYLLGGQLTVERVARAAVGILVA